MINFLLSARDPAERQSLNLYVSHANPAADPDQASFFLRNINEVAGLSEIGFCDPNSGAQYMESECQLGLQKHEVEGDCRGFERAPAFCLNTGSSQGTGCFHIPEDMQVVRLRFLQTD